MTVVCRESLIRSHRQATVHHNLSSIRREVCDTEKVRSVLSKQSTHLRANGWMKRSLKPDLLTLEHIKPPRKRTASMDSDHPPET